MPSASYRPDDQIVLHLSPSSSPRLVSPSSPAHSFTTEVTSFFGPLVPMPPTPTASDFALPPNPVQHPPSTIAQRPVSTFAQLPPSTQGLRFFPERLGGAVDEGSTYLKSPPDDEASTSLKSPTPSFIYPEGSTIGIKSRHASYASGSSGQGPHALSPEDVDSPTLGRFLSTGIRPKGSSRKISIADAIVPPEPSPADTASSTLRIERNLVLPFLPGFLHLMHSGSVASRRRSSATRKSSVPSNRVSVISSDDESVGGTSWYHDAIVESARSQTVKRAGRGAEVVALKDILGEKRVEENMEKATRVLGENVKVIKHVDAETVGALPETQDEKAEGFLAGEAFAPRDGEEGKEEEKKGLGIWMDGLRINPIRRSSTTPPTPSKPKRKVTFPGPPLAEVAPEHKFLRQSVVSTPYPHDRAGTVAKKSSKPHKVDWGGEDEVEKAIITLVLRRNSGHGMLVKKVEIPREIKEFVPRLHGPKGGAEVKSPPARSKVVADFDDEKLFRLVRKEASRMRGWPRRIASARKIQGVRLISFRRDPELAFRNGACERFGQTRILEDDSAQSRLMSVFTSPKLGRGSRRWIDWVENLPENSGTDESAEKQLAFGLVEDWGRCKICVAVVGVLLASLAAMVLWTFLGIGGQSDRGDGFRGAGERVETGVILGILVLLLGWTGVGAWALLSWLLG